MCYYSWLYWSFVNLCILGILMPVVLERVSSSGPSTMAVNTPTTSTSAVRNDLQGWLLPSSSTRQTTSATQHSPAVPLMASAPGAVSQPAYAASPSNMQMPIPCHTEQAAAINGLWHGFRFVRWRIKWRYAIIQSKLPFFINCIL